VPSRAPRHDRPLLVLFDGQNVFDDAPSFAGGWHAHAAVERLAKSVSAPVVVGIDHGHEHRLAELSPFDFRQASGKLDELLRWIIDWLLPKLRAEHGLTASAHRTVVGGSSMGGLAATYAVLARPDVFGGAIAMSPSLWVARGAIFRWAERRNVPANARIYLDGGAREPAAMLAGARRMAELLAGRGVREVRFRDDPNGTHSERSWRRRLLPALRFHFGYARSTRRA
jgi:enterochelin esterase-like enzyme